MQRTANPNEGEAIAKYERRGWPLLDVRAEAELEGKRRVGDDMTWVISFDPSAAAEAAVEAIRFDLRRGILFVLGESEDYDDD